MTRENVIRSKSIHVFRMVVKVFTVFSCKIGLSCSHLAPIDHGTVFDHSIDYNFVKQKLIINEIVI